MTLLEIRGGYLYQHRPDIFPEGFLTDTELLLWDQYYKDRQARRDAK